MTTRHDLRTEKAQRNTCETGSDTRSTNRSKALSAFIAKKAEIDEMLSRLQGLSDAHFNFDPDAVNWGSVGSISSVASDLREITDFLFGEGEYAE